MEGDRAFNEAQVNKVTSVFVKQNMAHAVNFNLSSLFHLVGISTSKYCEIRLKDNHLFEARCRIFLDYLLCVNTF